MKVHVSLVTWCKRAHMTSYARAFQWSCDLIRTHAHARDSESGKCGENHVMTKLRPQKTGHGREAQEGAEIEVEEEEVVEEDGDGDRPREHPEERPTTFLNRIHGTPV